MVRRRRTTTVADDDGGRRRRHARLGGGLQWRRTREGGERGRRQRSGDDGCVGGKWRRRVTMAAVGDDGDGGRRQRRTTKAADDDGTRDRVADYEGEGGGRTANNNGIGPAGQRARNKNKEIEFTQKDFFRRCGLSVWSFRSRRKQTPFLLDLSVVYARRENGPSTQLIDAMSFVEEF